MDASSVPDVFVLGDPLGSRAFRGEIVSDVDTFALTRGEVTPSRPILVKHDRGATLYDVIWTTNAAPVIISDRAARLLEENQVSGWSTYEVDLRDRDGDVIDGYSGLSVLGRCGPIRDDLSPSIEAVYPGGRTKRRLGWRFDPDTWDGSDIFVPSDGSAVKFVTDSVRGLLERAKVRNLTLRNAATIKRLVLGHGASGRP
jgi:hypothetical protein